MKRFLQFFLFFLILSFLGAGFYFASTQLFLFKSADQKIKWKYELTLKEKATQVLSRFYDKQDYEVVVSVDLESNARKEERIIQKPNKIALQEKSRSQQDEEKNFPKHLAKQDQKRDLSQPGFANIMPDKGRYERWALADSNNKFSKQNVVNKTDSSIEKVFVNTIKSEVIRPKNTVNQSRVFVLLNQDVDHVLSMDDLQVFLIQAMGLDVTKGDVFVLKQSRFIAQLSWFEQAKAWVFSNQRFCLMGAAGLALIFCLFGLFKLIKFYLQRPSKNKEDAHEDPLKEEDSETKPLTLSEKKEKLVELAKNEPHKLKELLDLWVS
eukprot:COSAG04_NODE_4255_length_2204_cov_1.321615_2_plen_323_part_00